MTDKSMVELASQIDHFEDSGNYERIYFKKGQDPKALRNSLQEIGITDIIKDNTMTTGHMFEVNYRYSKQKAIVDDLENQFMRLKAFYILRGRGGPNMTKLEEDFFAKEDTKNNQRLSEWKLAHQR